MSNDITMYERGLFRVRERLVPHRDEPYTFVDRIGAVTVMGVYMDQGRAQLLSIFNERAGYASALGLPGGNLEGGFDNPEHPALAARRELREETGYTADDSPASQSTFVLRPVSSTIQYPRFVSIIRNIAHTEDADDNPNEKVTLQPEPLRAYMHQLIEDEREEAYPEVASGFRRLERALGDTDMINWIIYGSDYGLSDVDVNEITSPFMTLLDPQHEGPISSIRWEK